MAQQTTPNPGSPGPQDMIREYQHGDAPPPVLRQIVHSMPVGDLDPQQLMFYYTPATTPTTTFGQPPPVTLQAQQQNQQ